MRSRETARITRETTTCETEGCGRPAQGPLCETCELERALYHREGRRTGFLAAPPRPR
jgi:hypothetical protein